MVLQVGHNRRRQAANRRIKELIATGELGAPLEVSSTHAAPLLFNPNLAQWRRRLEETPVGGMAALGVHQVDTFHYLAGPIEGVFARSTRLLPKGRWTTPPSSCSSSSRGSRVNYSRRWLPDRRSR